MGQSRTINHNKHAQSLLTIQPSMIADALIERIKSAAEIYTVVADHVELKKSGKDWKGLCPFHADTAPSFSVSPSRNVYTCFVCGAKGGPVDFVMNYHKIPFPQAIKHIADKYRIEIPSEPETAQAIDARISRDSASAALVSAQAFFLSHAPRAFTYMQGRGFSAETLEKFAVGFSPDGMGSFCNSLGITDDEPLKKAGLLSEKDGRTFDTFRGRVMFPIHSQSGKLIAFGGRVLDNSKPKYLNSADTILYSKKAVLYALHNAHAEIVRTGTVVITEGFTDVMRLHDRGATNSVATCGTALTPEQCKVLARLANTAILIYDGDNAGHKATQRAIPLILASGLSVKILNLPKNTDPDTWSRSYDGDVPQYIADNAVCFVDYYFSVYSQFSVETQPLNRAEVAKELGNHLKSIAEPILRHEFAKKASVLFGIEFLAQIPELPKSAPEKPTAKNPGTNISSDEMMSAIEDSKQSEHHFELWNLWREGNCYHTIKETKDGNVPIVLSNFVMQFIYHFDDGSINTRRLVKIQREDGTISLFELEDGMTGLNKLKPVLMSKSAVWHGSQQHLDKLYAWLLNDCVPAQSIMRIGYMADRNLYALSDALIIDGIVHKADEVGIVRSSGANYYLPAWSRYSNADAYENQRRSCWRPGSLDFANWSRLFYKAYGVNGAIGILYLIACIHRDILYSKVGFFPYLFLYGQAGSGKSTYAEMMLRLWGGKDPGVSAKSNFKGIARSASQRTNALLYIKEYDNTIPMDLETFFKNAYDGNGYTIAERSGDDRTKTFLVKSGILLDGNSLPTKTLPLYDRMIVLGFESAHFSDESSCAHDELKSVLDDGFGSVLLEIIASREIFAERVSKSFNYALNQLKGRACDFDGHTVGAGPINYNGVDMSALPDRTLQHLAFMSSVFYALSKHFSFPFSHNDVITQLWTDAIEKNNMMNANNPREVFWDAVNYTSNTERFRCQEGRQWVTDVIDSTVFVKMQELYPCYVDYCKKTGTHAEDKHTLIKHLTNPTYAPFVKTQNGGSNTTMRSGFGRCYQFKYEDKGGGNIVIGDKVATFMQIRS